MVTLTDEMIRLYGLTGAMAGEEASPEDMAIMSMGSAAPVTPTAPTDDLLRPRIRPETATAGQTIATPSPVTPTTTAPSDPYSNLNDFQRRMLRFAAIKDAGMALQGKEGNSVATILGDITKQKDMARKAAAATQAAEAQANLYSSLLGGGADSGSGGLLGADILSMNENQLKQYKQQLFNAAMVVGPSGTPLIPLNIIQAKSDQIDKQIEDIKASEGAIKQAELLEPRVEEALSYLNPDGAVDPETGEPVINPELANKFTRNFAAMIEEKGFIGFQDNINVIKNVLTFKNLLELKKQGATFGSLSEGELEKIADLAGNMDIRAPENVLRNLISIRKTIREAKERERNKAVKNINFGA